MEKERNVSGYPSILGAGLVCLDIIDSIENRYYNGGSCGNVAAALSFLGCSSSVLLNNYTDIAGQILLKNLEMLGIERITFKNRYYMTPRIIEMFYESDEGVKHKFVNKCPDCKSQLPSISLFTEKQVSDINVENYNMFYSDRSSKGISALRRLFNENGAWTIYEPNSSRNIAALIKNAKESHIVKFSSERITESVSEKIRDSCNDAGTVLIVRTAGSKGLYFCYRKRDNKLSNWIHLDAQPVANFVDSAGAGDWCTAGLLFVLGRKHKKRPKFLSMNEVISALQFGQALSAISCSFVGAQGIFYVDLHKHQDRTFHDIFAKESFKKYQLSNYQHCETSNVCPTCLMPKLN